MTTAPMPPRSLVLRRLEEPMPPGALERLEALARVLGMSGARTAIVDRVLVIDMTEISVRDAMRLIVIVRDLEALMPGGLVEQLRLLPEIDAAVEPEMRRAVATALLAQIESDAAIGRAKKDGGGDTLH